MIPLNSCMLLQLISQHYIFRQPHHYFKSYFFPTLSMICQKPVAPEEETALYNPLSITARYLKSSGILFFLSIGSITGNHRWALLIANMVNECQYVFTKNSLSILSKTSKLSRGTFSLQNQVFVESVVTLFSGILQSVPILCFCFEQNNTAEYEKQSNSKCESKYYIKIFGT